MFWHSREVASKALWGTHFFQINSCLCINRNTVTRLLLKSKSFHKYEGLFTLLTQCQLYCLLPNMVFQYFFDRFLFFETIPFLNGGYVNFVHSLPKVLIELKVHKHSYLLSTGCKRQLDNKETMSYLLVIYTQTNMH